jgi:uncharacterized protein (TIGR03435 family)
MRWTDTTLVTLTIVMVANSQSVPSGPTFEVAAIKEVGPSSDPLPDVSMFGFRGGPGTKSPERIEYSPVTLRMLIARAYDLRGEQILGSASLDEKRYSVTATLPPKSTPEQLRSMLQALLTERFDIRSHSEIKRMPVYLLTVKNATKLKPAEPPINFDSDVDKGEALRKAAESAMAATRNSGWAGYRRMRRPRATMAELAGELSSNLDRQVLDKTELTGRYAIQLTWDSSLGPADGDRGPSLLVAVEEQLGLRLRASVEEIKVLVVDGARSSPTSN